MEYFMLLATDAEDVHEARMDAEVLIKPFKAVFK